MLAVGVSGVAQSITLFAAKLDVVLSLIILPNMMEKGKELPASCPLTSTYVLWHAYAWISTRPCPSISLVCSMFPQISCMFLMSSFLIIIVTHTHIHIH